MAHALGMPCGVSDRDCASLRMPEQRKLAQSGSIDNRLQIMDPGLEGDILDIPLRESIAAAIVAQNTVIPGDISYPVPPDRALPFEVEMIEAIRDFHQRMT